MGIDKRHRKIRDVRKISNFFLKNIKFEVNFASKCEKNQTFTSKAGQAKGRAILRPNELQNNRSYPSRTAEQLVMCPVVL